MNYCIYLRVCCPGIPGCPIDTLKPGWGGAPGCDAYGGGGPWGGIPCLSILPITGLEIKLKQC